jgi:fucose permease
MFFEIDQRLLFVLSFVDYLLYFVIFLVAFFVLALGIGLHPVRLTPA